MKLFNVLFDKGVYPDNWTESIVVPLFKKGNINDVNNYRGISLCDVGSKIYGCIINARLQDWVELKNITGEHQAGFKKEHSTIDHMFTLLAAIQKQFNNNRKLYVAFVDFEKAFDNISRRLLWPILQKNGIRGKLFRSVKAMYITVKAKVRVGSQFTDLINCTRGVKQGDICSPILFTLYINELAEEIIKNGRHGIQLQPDVLELFIMLLADDMALLADTVVGLQVQLNNLYITSKQLELKVNNEKTNIVVFRKGGYLSSHERWSYGETEVKVVNAYKYLGLYFSTRLSFSSACNDLLSRAKHAVISIFNSLRKFDKMSFSVFIKLFDVQVQPIVLYGSEIWGLTPVTAIIEKVHLFALKRFLNVDMRTPNDLIYGECGRYPISINSNIRCISYWLKLIRMDNNRLPKKSYNMLYNLDSKGKSTWVTNVRNFLCNHGYQYVWLNQEVGCNNAFLKSLKLRLVDCRLQEWNSHLESSDRFEFYRTFKSCCSLEMYLSIPVNKFILKYLIKFRLGISCLAVHSNRYKNVHRNHLLCRLCGLAIEDEIHLILCCPALSDLRAVYIPDKYSKYPCGFKLALLLSGKNENLLCNLALFVYRALKRIEETSLVY